MHEYCQIVRRKLVTKSKLNIENGQHTEVSKEWVTEICGTPLFKEEHRKDGECRSCKSGWTHKNNYRI